MNHRITLRQVASSDTDFLLLVYAGSRADEMALVPWSEEDKREFLEMQLKAQREDYDSRFPEAEHSIVLVDGAPIGQIWVDRRDDEIRLLDIALLPEARNKGIGAELLRDLQQQAASSGIPLRHTVFKTNDGAVRLYHRLGFTVIEDLGMYALMEWRHHSASRA